MVSFICNLCSKEFEKKFNLDRHLNNKKKPCKPNCNNLQELVKNTKSLQEFAESIKKEEINDKSKQSTADKLLNKCEYCEKIYSSVYTLERHIANNCKIKKKQIKANNTQLDAQTKKMEEQIQELIKIVNELKDKPVKTQNINNIVVNNNNNINLLPHGSETKVDLLTVLEKLANHKDMLTIIPNMAKHIYIDTPEHKNFRILDLSRNKCEYYDGKKWVTGKTDDKIIKVFENVNNVLTAPFDKENLIKTLKFIENNAELKEKNKWITFSKGYCLSLYDESDPENIENKKKIINELKHIFFNYKDEILKIDI